MTISTGVKNESFGLASYFATHIRSSCYLPSTPVIDRPREAHLSSQVPPVRVSQYSIHLRSSPTSPDHCVPLRRRRGHSSPADQLPVNYLLVPHQLWKRPAPHPVHLYRGRSINYPSIESSSGCQQAFSLSRVACWAVVRFPLRLRSGPEWNVLHQSPGGILVERLDDALVDRLTNAAGGRGPVLLLDAKSFTK